jgi:hypothetical protein
MPALDRYAGSEHPVDAILLGLPVRYDPQEIQQLIQTATLLDQRHRCPVMLCIPASARQELAGTCGNHIKLLPKPITENRLSEALCDALKLETFVRAAEITPNIKHTAPFCHRDGSR